MAIGIISAMAEEIDMILAHIHGEKKTNSGMRTYYKGILCDTEIVAVFSRWGKVAAAITATDMINKFEIDQIVFVGVAGGVSPDIRIGDIVIGERLNQHDIDASPIFPRFEIPLLGRKSLQTDKNLKERLQQSCDRLFTNNRQILTPEIRQKFRIDNPQVFCGQIASGDRFISDSDERDELIRHFPDLLCVEMEGASVAQVCYEFGIPFGIVRVISDSANEHAGMDFQKFIKEVASIYTFEILQEFLQVKD